MNILFVCSRNQWRSPTAETIYRNRPGLSVRSAGTEPSARTKFSQKDLDWADIIFVMEKRNKERIFQKFPGATSKKIILLDIEDDYPYMDEELINEIQSKVNSYLSL